MQERKERTKMVTAVVYTNFRKDLKSYMRRVNDDADMLLMTNKDEHDDVVVMSTPFSSLKCNIALCCGLGLIVRGARGRVCFGRRVVPFARPMPRPV